ncbi:MAG: protease [Lewinellaceae bacterium]|nr:protease [Lewinellaceae bacterium]
MLKHFFSIAAMALVIVGLNSCAKKQEETNLTQGLPDAIQKQIISLGFNPENAFEADGGYIVENDIFLSKEDLNRLALEQATSLVIAEEEQYRTTNLVNAPRTITVRVNGTVPAAFSTSVDNAIARYNAENLGLTFQRVTSGGNIVIRLVNTNQYIASAGFPTGGNPYGEIKYAKKYTTGYSDGFMTTVLAHEMGHCIGFRHTDYMSRQYSCGGAAANEGAGDVGAVLIPGTPSGPDAASWMLACLGATTNRPFNANDKIALNYLY